MTSLTWREGSQLGWEPHSFLSLAAWSVGTGECGNRTVSARTLWCKQQKLNSDLPRQRNNLLALIKEEDIGAVFGSEGLSLGTRASVMATVRSVPRRLSPVLPDSHQPFTVSFHLPASFTLTPVEMFSVWQRTWQHKQRVSCLLPESTHQSQERTTGPITAAR